MRLIDADALKTKFIGFTTESGIHCDIDRYALKMIDEQPTVNQWIPVTERLPKHPENDGDYYLVTIQCEHYDGWDDYVTGFAEWTKHGWDSLSCYVGEIKVVAWMELPQPWEGEGNERA